MRMYAWDTTHGRLHVGTGSYAWDILEDVLEGFGGSPGSLKTKLQSHAIGFRSFSGSTWLLQKLHSNNMATCPCCAENMRLIKTCRAPPHTCPPAENETVLQFLRKCAKGDVENQLYVRAWEARKQGTEEPGNQ